MHNDLPRGDAPRPDSDDHFLPNGNAFPDDDKKRRVESPVIDPPAAVNGGKFTIRAVGDASSRDCFREKNSAASSRIKAGNGGFSSNLDQNRETKNGDEFASDCHRSQNQRIELFTETTSFSRRILDLFGNSVLFCSSSYCVERYACRLRGAANARCIISWA